jgi:hypothetical protein
MNRHRWAVAVVGLTIAAFCLGCGRGARDDDDKPAAKNSQPSRTAAGDPIVRLEPAAQVRIGL